MKEKPGYVYIGISSRHAREYGLMKIGCTQHPAIRPYKARCRTVVAFLQTNGRLSAYRLESFLHRKFADKEVYSEWFDLMWVDMDFIYTLKHPDLKLVIPEHCIMEYAHLRPYHQQYAIRER